MTHIIIKIEIRIDASIELSLKLKIGPNSDSTRSFGGREYPWTEQMLMPYLVVWMVHIPNKKIKAKVKLKLRLSIKQSIKSWNKIYNIW